MNNMNFRFNFFMEFAKNYLVIVLSFKKYHRIPLTFFAVTEYFKGKNWRVHPGW